MSAEVLREAAALMRERAEAASPSPWSGHQYPIDTDGEGGDITVRDPDGFDVALMTSDQFNDCPHVASWHPTVALAVADWLESTAAENNSPEDSALGFLNFITADSHAALAVARAYLGSDS